jgi:hypothetical protein
VLSLELAVSIFHRFVQLVCLLLQRMLLVDVVLVLLRVLVLLLLLAVLGHAASAIAIVPKTNSYSRNYSTSY